MSDGSNPAASALQTARVAVLVPCYNEAPTIGTVVADFRRALPSAVVYVYDNNSTDETTEVAARAGAVVRHEPLQGKGNVVRRMFQDVEADVYVMVDGDDTYDAGRAAAWSSGCCANPRHGRRRARRDDRRAYRPGHASATASDGPRALPVRQASRRHAVRLPRVLAPVREELPVARREFEIETELTVHALQMRDADRRGRDDLRRAAARLDEQAAHVPRRLAHPAHDRAARQGRAATRISSRASRRSWR